MVLFTVRSYAQYDDQSSPYASPTEIATDPSYNPTSPPADNSSSGSTVYPSLPDNGVGGNYTPGAGGGGSNTGSDPGGGLNNPDTDAATWPAPFDSGIIILLVAGLVYGGVKTWRNSKRQMTGLQHTS